MITAPLRFHDGHPVVTLEDADFLVDTGCPFSFGSVGAVVVDGRRHALGGPEGVGPFNLHAVQTLAGRVVGVLGMDVVGERAWTFDVERHELRVGEGAEAAPATAHVEISSQGAPIIAAGHERILFDTGARLAFRIGAIPDGSTAAGEATDYSPFLGHFQTPVWQQTVVVAGIPVPVRFGVLPAKGEALLRMLNVNWIIGQDLLRAGCVTLDTQRRRLGLHPAKRSGNCGEES